MVKSEYEPTTISPEYARYIRSGVWKCTPQPPLPPSPTGAHHWIEVTGPDILPGTFVCKYCWENKRFPLSLGPYGR